MKLKKKPSLPKFIPPKAKSKPQKGLLGKLKGKLQKKHWYDSDVIDPGF